MNITEALQQLLNEGGDHNCFMLQLNKDFYLQIAGTKGSPLLILEAVSNKFLPKNKQLTKKQQDHLIRLGWELSESNYTMQRLIQTSADVVGTVEVIQLTAAEVYDTKVIDQHMIELSLDT